MKTAQDPMQLSCMFELWVVGFGLWGYSSLERLRPIDTANAVWKHRQFPAHNDKGKNVIVNKSRLKFNGVTMKMEGGTLCFTLEFW